MNYPTIARTLTRVTPAEENIESPYKDIYQDGWVRVITKRNKDNRVIPNVRTIEELDEVLGDDKALLVVAARQAQLNELTKRRTRAKTKKEFVSLDDTIELEDHDVTRQFESIEASESIKQILKSLNEREREAVKCFIDAWILKESGFSVPKSTQMRLSRFRKETGLALTLA